MPSSLCRLFPFSTFFFSFFLFCNLISWCSSSLLQSASVARFQLKATWLRVFSLTDCKLMAVKNLNRFQNFLKLHSIYQVVYHTDDYTYCFDFQILILILLTSKTYFIVFLISIGIFLYISKELVTINLPILASSGL